MGRCCIPIVAIGFAGLLTACSPTFNWRAQVIGATGLDAMFPCKPETVTRSVPIAGSDRTVAMRTCDAGGVTFAVAHAALEAPAQVPMVLIAWRASTLAGLLAEPASTTSKAPPGLPALPQLQVLRATGAAGGSEGLLMTCYVFMWTASIIFAILLWTVYTIS